MTVIEQLQEASFEDFVFLTNVERNASGKKVVLHEYPNSDKRFAEELGRVPDTITLDAIVHGDVSSRLYFEQLLRKPGRGKLVHPVYGDLTVMVGQYTVASNQTRIGEFTFSITFYGTEANVSPETTAPTQNQIPSDVGFVQIGTDDAIAAIYGAPSTVDSWRAAYNNAIDFLEETVALVDAVLSPAEEARTIFNTLVATTRATIATVVQTPTALASMLSSMFDALTVVSNDPSSTTSVWRSLIAFGDDAADIETTTVKRQEIKKNVTAINDYIQINALAQLYSSMAFTDFTTADELQDGKDELAAAYDKIVVNRLTADDLQQYDLIAMQPAVRSALATLRNDSLLVFKAQQVNVWRINNISQPLSSVLLSTYQYYGDIDNVDIIAELNPEINAAGFRGDLKIVS